RLPCRGSSASRTGGRRPSRRTRRCASSLSARPALPPDASTWSSSPSWPWERGSSASGRRRKAPLPLRPPRRATTRSAAACVPWATSSERPWPRVPADARGSSDALVGVEELLVFLEREAIRHPGDVVGHDAGDGLALLRDTPVHMRRELARL